jgi:hypothetical protein
MTASGARREGRTAASALAAWKLGRMLTGKDFPEDDPLNQIEVGTPRLLNRRCRK